MLVLFYSYFGHRKSQRTIFFPETSNYAVIGYEGKVFSQKGYEAGSVQVENVIKKSTFLANSELKVFENLCGW